MAGEADASVQCDSGLFRDLGRPRLQTLRCQFNASDKNVQGRTGLILQVVATVSSLERLTSRVKRVDPITRRKMKTFDDLRTQLGDPGHDYTLA